MTLSLHIQPALVPGSGATQDVLRGMVQVIHDGEPAPVTEWDGTDGGNTGQLIITAFDTTTSAALATWTADAAAHADYTIVSNSTAAGVHVYAMDDQTVAASIAGGRVIGFYYHLIHDDGSAEALKGTHMEVVGGV